MQLSWLERRRTSEAGFTLVELVVTVAMVGIIVVSLTGVVIAYLKVTVSTSARLTASHDTQFAAAYWQRDVASIGIRSMTYCKTATTDPACSAQTVHIYPLVQSVNVSPTCALPSGTVAATLAWSAYSVDDPDQPETVTVSYVAQPSGARYLLVRRRCTGSTVDSTVTVANNLTAVPTLNCPGVASCTGAGSAVPTVVTLSLSSSDPDDTSGSPPLTTKLIGERRET